jgi:membrane glycosyltransferase
MIVGIGLAILTYWASWPLFFWLLPATLGLLLSGPLSALSARRSVGEFVKRLGIFVSPEERVVPTIAISAQDYSERLAKEFSKHEAISQLAGDPQLRHLHRQLIELQPVTREARMSPSLAVGRAKLEISADLPELLRLLKPNEKAALLSDPESLARLETMIIPFAQTGGGAPTETWAAPVHAAPNS